MKRIKNISIKEIIGILKFLVLIIPAFLYKKIRKKEIWMISEYLTARDNGYFFFKYMKEQHPEICSYYAIDFKNEDYDKVKELKDVINWGSFKHYFYYMTSNKKIMSHKNGNPNHLIFAILLKYLNLYKDLIFLQHGVTKDDVPMFYYKNAKFRLFICGAKPEYDYISDKFGYPDENVKYTGFSRFDNLHNQKVNKDVILLMPTWRRWLNSNDDFLNSKYFEKLQSLINNKELKSILERFNKKVIFCTHLSSKKYVHNFKTSNEYISIMKPEDVDIQRLLIESSFLITDYSSVAFDFAYMKKPVAYYQFDLLEYREKHLTEGYFDYTRDGFGPVFEEEHEMVDYIKNILENNYNIDDKYIQNTEKFFPIYDEENSKRIFEEISKI